MAKGSMAPARNVHYIYMVARSTIFSYQELAVFFSLSWNQHILASGCREGVVVLHDVRVAQHQVARMEGHQQEVPSS